MDSDNDKEASVKPLPQGNHREYCIPEPETDAKLAAQRAASLNSEIEDRLPFKTGTGLEVSADKNAPLSNLAISSSLLGEDICLAESLAHTLELDSLPISVIENDAKISQEKPLIHPDNSTVIIQGDELSQPITEDLTLPVLALHNSTSPRAHPTDRCITLDMLTVLERYLDDFEAI